MNPRVRYHKRKPVDPRLSQKKRVVIVAAGFIAGAVAIAGVLLVVYQALGRSDFFQITAIRIEGCQKTSKSQVLEYSGVDIHTNLLVLDVDEIRTKVESGQWIMRAEVRKQWPNRLEISVKEYAPVAMVAIDTKLFYVDRDGKAFAEALPPEEMDYPVITGLSGLEGDGAAENAKTLKYALGFISYASLGNLNLPVQNISEINVSNQNDLVLFLVDRPFPIRIGAVGEALKIKYSRLARVLSWLYRHKKFGTTEYIDMASAAEQILVGQDML
ncbi:MAG: FtsQ-type POTRA domain-containing protein [Proteobacteria bacterium]|nr:FtsQ-type POTRA domain-containing protein [Pseudomonadota bacterium]MBU1738970.1 FtsQ-type POTRA domain-containing protein [Pseudomonadota bacterium]